MREVGTRPFLILATKETLIHLGYFLPEALNHGYSVKRTDNSFSQLLAKRHQWVELGFWVGAIHTKTCHLSANIND